MKILFLSDNFPPEVNAPASRTHEHCREWVRAGHEVVVITCFPNFPKGVVYDGYKNKWRQRELVDGIKVIRVWSYITPNSGFLKRTLDYLSFALMAIIASVSVKRCEVVIATSPQFFTAVAGWVVGALKNIPFVFELRDIWPASIKAVGAMDRSVILNILEKLELFLYRRAAIIIAVTESFRTYLCGLEIDPRKIHVVTNGVDTSRFNPLPKDSELEKALGLTGKFVAGYIGTHGMAHALETILLAAEKLQNDSNFGHVHFLFLGDGAEKKELQQITSSKALKNVTFIDSVPKALVAKYWALLDVSIIHLKSTTLFNDVIPSKIFEAMAMGVPLLHGVQGESAEIVEKEGIGLVFQSENSHQLVDQLTKLKNSPNQLAGMKENCLKAAQKYDRRILALKMLAIIKQSSPLLQTE